MGQEDSFLCYFVCVLFDFLNPFGIDKKMSNECGQVIVSIQKCV